MSSAFDRIWLHLWVFFKERTTSTILTKLILMVQRMIHVEANLMNKSSSSKNHQNQPGENGLILMIFQIRIHDEGKNMNNFYF